jgi:hypothetical protein
MPTQVFIPLLVVTAFVSAWLLGEWIIRHRRSGS